MSEARWPRRRSLAVLALASLVTLTGGPARAADEPTTAQRRGAPRCTPWPERAAAVVRTAADGAWHRLTALIDQRGWLSGWRLEVGARGTSFTSWLPVESSAAGPFSGVVLATSDDGISSKVVAHDALTGCRRQLFTSSDVVRRVTLDPSRRQLYLHLVERGTRRDLGVWRHALTGGAIDRVVPPPPLGVEALRAYGPTFSTEFAWADDGRRLAVHSCGAAHCRSRVLDLTTGSVVTLERHGIGDVIGYAAGRLVTYAACRGLPCPVLATTVATGRVTLLVDAAGSARIVSRGARPRLVYETWRGARRALVGLDLTTGSGRTLPISTAAAARGTTGTVLR